MEPLIRLDQDRIGDRFVKLLDEARQRDTDALLTFAAAQRKRMFIGGRRGGRSFGPPLPPPWKEIAPGAWWAPPGTPQPPISVLPPTAEEMRAWLADMPVIDADTMRPPGDLTADEMLDLLREPDPEAYRRQWAKVMHLFQDGSGADASR